MGLIRCKDCSRQISRGADACPGCGRPNRGFLGRPGRERERNLGCLAVLIVVVAMMAAFSVSSARDTLSASATAVAPSHPPPVPPKGIVADRFRLDWSISGDALTLSIDTDLPDSASLFVTVARTYYQKSDHEAYERDYYHTSSPESVGQWRSARRISLSADAWKTDLADFQAKMARCGSDTAFEVERIDDEIEIRAVVHLNQSDPRFGGPRNGGLSGKAVKVEDAGTDHERRLVEAELRVRHPLDGPPPPAKTTAVSADSLEVGVTYRISRETVLDPELEPADPIADIGRMLRLPVGTEFTVKEARDRRGSTFYRNYRVKVARTGTWSNTRREGLVAIEYAAEHGLTLCKYGELAENSREGLSVTEARRIAARDANLVYLDVLVPNPAVAGAADGAEGWIDSVALIGQNVDAVVPDARDTHEPSPSVSIATKASPAAVAETVHVVVVFKNGRRIEALEAVEAGNEVRVRVSEGVSATYQRSSIASIEKTAEPSQSR